MIFDIRTFGAVGDGKTLDTAAINRAIEAAAAVGGGTVYFPAGTWLSFSIHLKSKVEIYLSQGAVLLAADSPLPGQTTGYNGGTYDAAEPKTSYDPYQDYGHNHWHNSLLWGENINNISITGPGLIWGKGLSFGAGPGRGPAGAGASGAGFGPERTGPRPGATPATGAPATGAPGATPPVAAGALGANGRPAGGGGMARPQGGGMTRPSMPQNRPAMSGPSMAANRPSQGAIDRKSVV